jgi:hypothetical protein
MATKKIRGDGGLMDIVFTHSTVIPLILSCGVGANGLEPPQ